MSLDLATSPRGFTNMKEFMANCAMMNQVFNHAEPMRLWMWEYFSLLVNKHVTDYTVPQYGDYPTDNITSWSAEDCITQIKKYAARLSTNARGEEESLRDLLKIAHYCSLAYLKKLGLEKEFVLPSDEELTQLLTQATGEEDDVAFLGDNSAETAADEAEYADGDDTDTEDEEGESDDDMSDTTDWHTRPKV